MAVAFGKVAIIGVGLIGGSIALALKAHDENITVYGITHEGGSLEQAVSAGMLDEAACADDERVDAWLGADGVELVVIATPVSAAREWFERLEACGFAGVITDVASTKGAITRIAEQTLSDTTRYLPGHPMAGSEVSGFSAARADLFQGAYWILCPDDDTRDDVFLALHETFSSLGARVISLEREQHDSAVAIVSHVPHIMASAIVELTGRHSGERKEILHLAAGGFKDTTRIAAGSPELWCGIALDNRDAVADGLSELEDIIAAFERAIRTEDAATLTDLLAKSASLRRSLPAAWVPDSAKLTEVRIPMRDHTGIIAEVTGIAGHAGCNIQSIDIDHINESTAVLELILTDEGDMGRLGADLINAGYDFSFRGLGE